MLIDVKVNFLTSAPVAEQAIFHQYENSVYSPLPGSFFNSVETARDLGFDRIVNGIIAVNTIDQENRQEVVARAHQVFMNARNELEGHQVTWARNLDTIENRVSWWGQRQLVVFCKFNGER